MKQIDDITLIKFLGRGSFGEVYLSTKRGKKEYFATKRIDRETADQPGIFKYIQNEINIMKNINHQNIIKFEDFKATKENYYLVMEYVNGGGLDNCLKKYIQKYGKPFSEEIVQFLMRQIVDAIKYMHNLKIMHRDIKSDNIMINFDSEIDKKNLNMMNSKVKIIDLGLSIYIKNGLTYTAVGNPQNMDPLILKKFLNINYKSIGYDQKADIWSLGSLCYELLFGQAVFDSKTMNELVNKVENGTYKVPTNISKEVVSFLNGMLQYEAKNRYSANELANHPFLKKKVTEFNKINVKLISKKIENGKLKINVKKNQTIWSIFNLEDEKKLIEIKNINDIKNESSIKREDYNYFKKNDNNNCNQRYNININNPVPIINANNLNDYKNFMPLGGKNLYGKPMFPLKKSLTMNPRENFPTFNIPKVDIYGGLNNCKTQNFENNSQKTPNNDNIYKNYVQPIFY